MEKRFNVLVLGNVRKEGLDILHEFAELMVLPEPVQKYDILECIPHADAILHKIAKIDAEIIATQTKVQLLARHGVGLDYLDLAAINAANIPVSITPMANSNAVAEATIGLTLAAIRKFSQGEAMIKTHHEWQRENVMGCELANATVGIIGFGRVGRRVAKLFDAFGSKICTYDPQPQSLKDCRYEVADIDTLISKSDIICLHCPLMNSTRHIINEFRIGLMKETAFLINTSRGPLIDNKALVNAVRTGKIGGAALDVFDSEPPDFDDPLFREPRILTTPHIAAMTIEAQIAMAVGAASEIRRVLVENIEPTNNIFATSL